MNVYRCSVLFLKSDKIGYGELGKNLFVNFLNILPNLENAPSKILCVNESILVNVDENHKVYLAMKELEKQVLKLSAVVLVWNFFKKVNSIKL